MKRNTVFVVQISWLVVLGVLAGLYFTYGDTVLLENPLGAVPVAVVWFGALGAVLFSINGINDHAHDWDPTLYLWHLSRPLIGAALAVIAVLIIKAGVLAIGLTPATSTSPPAAPVATGPEIPKDLLYYLVGFLVGYREETFRELMKKFADLFLTTAPAKPEKTAPTITEMQPAKAPIAGHVPMVINGAGLASTKSVLFGTHPAEFHVESDTRLTVPDVPATDAAGPVPVVVKTEAGAASMIFQYAA